MGTLLHIDVSVRGAHSLSRDLSRRFVDGWVKAYPDTYVLRRDLALTPPPFVDQGFLAAAFTAAEERTAGMRAALAVSDVLISEVEASDVLVLGTPMYNYGMPAPLKAWVDQVIRIGRTFSFDLVRGDFPLAPILSGKALVLLTASGEFGFAPGGVREEANHLDTHFAVIRHLLGADMLFHAGVEYQEFKDDRHAASIAAAQAAIPSLVQQVASSLGSAKQVLQSQA